MDNYDRQANSANFNSEIIYDKLKRRIELRGSEEFTENLFKFMFQSGLVEWENIDMSEVEPTPIKKRQKLGLAQYFGNGDEHTTAQLENSDNDESLVNTDSRSRQQYTNSSLPEPANDIASDVKISAEKLMHVLDFHSGQAVPTLIYEFDYNSRARKQREGTLLLLYFNKIVHDEDNMLSNDISELLRDCNIDPKSLAMAFRTEEYKPLIKRDGHSYRILYQGINEARKLLKSICE